MRLSRFLVLLLLCGTVAAQTTKTWEESSFDDFEKGTSKGVAILSDGSLELAPDLKQLVTTPSTFLWSAVSDASGNLFVAGGSPAKVYRVTADGKVTVVLSPAELQVQALAIDRDGTLYAATAPDGKVYKITPTSKAATGKAVAPSKTVATPSAKTPEVGPSKDADKKADTKAEEPKLANDPAYTSSVFYEPKQKYIWTLAIDSAGRLYVGTGDKGEIHRVEQNGTGSIFFKSDEAHIRSMAFDNHGDLIAGSDGSGLIYRISPDGKGFVLYSAPKKEITAILVDSQGVIYAAAAGDKKPASGQPAPFIQNQSAGASHTIAPAQPVPTISAPVAPQMIPVPGLGATGSDIYRIESNGTPRKLWSSRDDLVYALAIDHSGRLLAGTGNKGKIYAIRNDGEYIDLQKAAANQVVAFAAAPGSDLYTITSNLGKIFLVQDATQRDGTFDSDVYDTRIFSRFGRAEMRSRGNVELWARSGNVDNPDRNWSNWSRVDLSNPLEVPQARFVQWRTVLHSGLPSAHIDSVKINFLPHNIAPEIEDVSVQVGSRFNMVPRNVTDVLASANSPNAPQRFDTQPSANRDQDSIAVRWNAHDDNDDTLSYSIYYRGDGESRWLLLKDGLADRFYSFDAALLPDGGYSIKVVASDAPSQSPGDALTGSKESAHFDVDNTPPQVSALTGTMARNEVHVRFSAADAISVIKRAEYSVDAGDWHFVAPAGGLSDSKSETYDFYVPVATRSSGGEISDEHVVVVRIYDRADNLGTAKVVVRPTPETKP